MEKRRAFKIKHTYRKHNKMADYLVNEAMSRRVSRTVSFNIPQELDEDLHGRLLPLLAQDLQFDPHSSDK